jgi:hypothetical protein
MVHFIIDVSLFYSLENSYSTVRIAGIFRCSPLKFTAKKKRVVIVEAPNMPLTGWAGDTCIPHLLPYKLERSTIFLYPLVN